MKIDWTVRGDSVPDSFKERVDQQVTRLERYLSGHTEASVVVSEEGDPEGSVRKGFELIVRNRLGTFTASEETHDLAEAANVVLKRVQAQVQKAHDKLIGRRRGGGGGEAWVETPAGD